MNENITLRQGLEKYYASNPSFTRNADIWVGNFRVPWRDLERHDLMHVVTGYNTSLDQELKLIGFLLTALTLRRPWYYYAQSFVVFLELLWKSIWGESFGDIYYSPWAICSYYWQGVTQGLTVKKKINAYIDSQTVIDRPITELRNDYGIANAGAWD